jgi:hypothetical protein
MKFHIEIDMENINSYADVKDIIQNFVMPSRSKWPLKENS